MVIRPIIGLSYLANGLSIFAMSYRIVALDTESLYFDSVEKQ